MDDKENFQELVERAANNLQEVLSLYSMRPFYLYNTIPRWSKMLDWLLRTVGLKVPEIPLNEPDVFEMMSAVAELEGHPYLPERSIFFLGSVWELPGIGQKCCARALKELGAVHSFFELVQVTKKALAYTRKGKVSLDDACGNALKGYVFTYLFLRCPAEWNRRYCQFMHPICMREKEEEESEQKYADMCRDIHPFYTEEEEYTEWYYAIRVYKISPKERRYKHYWEDALMLLPDDDNDDNRHYMFLFPWVLRSRLYEGYPESPAGVFEIETENVFCNIKKAMIKEGTLIAIPYAEEELKGTCSDFWTWLNEEKEYRKDPELERIACYCPSVITYQQKLELLHIAAECYIVEETFQPQFCTEKPMQPYDERRRMVSLQEEKRKSARFQDLKAYFDSFTKFSADTESGKLFEECTEEEIQSCLRKICNQDLVKAFVLYHPAQRAHILEKGLGFRLQITLLEDFEYLTQPQNLCLTECAQAAKKIENILKRHKNKPKNMEETRMETKTDEKLREKIVSKWRERTGSTHINFPGGILLKEEADEKKVTMVFSEMKWFYSANMREDSAAFEAWALAIYTDYLDEAGNVCLDIRSEDLEEIKKKEIMVKYQKEKSCIYTKERHYSRFLYRALRFSEQYGAWFSLSERLGELVSGFASYLEEHKFTNHSPGAEASDSDESTEEEAIIERIFSDDVPGEPEPLLKECLSVDRIHRQLPVGLYEISDDSGCRKDMEEKPVFPGGKAAIDLWATDGEALKVLELKAESKSNKVAAVTELFFYSNYAYDMFIRKDNNFLQQKGASNARGYGELSDSLSHVEGYLLLDRESHHPLMGKKVLNALNHGANDAITYASLTYEYIDIFSKIIDVKGD